MQEQVKTLHDDAESLFKENWMQTFARAWEDTDPKAIRNAAGFVTGYVEGSRGLSKMMQFVKKHPLTNAMIDSLMALPAARMKDEDPEETFEQYKRRQKFCKALAKFRYRIFNYDAIDEEKEARKASYVDRRVKKLAKQSS